MFAPALEFDHVCDICEEPLPGKEAVLSHLMYEYVPKWRVSLTYLQGLGL